MTPPPSQKRTPKGRKGRKPQLGGKTSIPEVAGLISAMDQCPNAEILNERVISPFIEALVDICDARGYVLNIYGDHCNLAVTPESHAENIYRLIESYLDEADLE